MDGGSKSVDDRLSEKDNFLGGFGVEDRNKMINDWVAMNRSQIKFLEELFLCRGVARRRCLLSVVA